MTGVNCHGRYKMGTFLKYVFYVALVIVLYLVAKGVYDGNINKNTTVGSVVQQVEDGGEQLAEKGAKKVENAVKDYQNAPKLEVK